MRVGVERIKFQRLCVTCQSLFGSPQFIKKNAKVEIGNWVFGIATQSFLVIPLGLAVILALMKDTPNIDQCSRGRLEGPVRHSIIKFQSKVGVSGSYGRESLVKPSLCLAF